VALVRVCDLHDLSEWWVEVTATRRFGLDGRFYEVDLCAEHDVALDQVLAPYLAAARQRARRASGRRNATKT
jgi:erythromycin esterase-like protein